jgi:hypothetical protein
MPGDAERVDISVLVETLPVLLEEEGDLPDGAVDAVVISRATRARHLFSIDQGRRGGVRDTDTTVTATRAGMEADEAASIMALGPARGYSGLRCMGEEQLARQVLDALLPAV